MDGYGNNWGQVLQEIHMTNGWGQVAPVMQFLGWVIGCAVLLLIFFVLTQVFWGVAAYRDAVGKGSTLAVMWGVLVGFLGIIPGIIYLCLRNGPTGKERRCPQCGMSYKAEMPYCPGCRATNPVTPEQYYAQQSAPSRGKGFFIAGCVFFGLTIVMVLVLVFGMLPKIFELAQVYNGYWY